MDIGVYLKHWGPLALFGFVLAEQLGLPLPAFPVLLLAGALARQAGGWGLTEWLAAGSASLMGGLVWFWLGRRYSRSILRQLCRISLSPDICVRQSELAFEKRGPLALIGARFVPGVSLLAPPLAGGLGMPLPTFALFHGAAAMLYAGAGIGSGLLFYDQLRGVLDWLAENGAGALSAVVLLMGIWLGRKFWLRRKQRLATDITRISAAQLADALRSGHSPLILDARSHIAREHDGGKVADALEFDWDDAGAIDRLPSERAIVTYCSCPNDVSALALARRIRQSGRHSVQVLAGGLDSWVQAMEEGKVTRPAGGTSQAPD